MRSKFSFFTASFYAVTATIAISFLLHMHVLHKDIVGVHMWRQSQTMLNIRNFYRHDANILNPRVAHFNGQKDNLYRYEFPYMQWLVSRMQVVFGEDIFYVRIFMFLVGVFSLFGLYSILRQLLNHDWAAYFGVWSLTFSPVFYYYMVNPLPDNMALCMGIWYIFFFIKSVESSLWRHHTLAAFFLLMATLAKLPFIVLGGATLTYLLLSLKGNFSKTAALGGLYFLMITPALAWYAWVMPGWEGNPVLSGIFDGKMSLEQALGILTYHANTMFPELLLNPVSVVFLFMGLYGFFKNKHYQSPTGLGLMVAALSVWLYFLLELSAIDTLHDYYMMPFIPFLYVMLGYGILLAWKQDRLLQGAVILALVLMPMLCLRQTRKWWTPEIVSNVSNPNLTYYQKELKDAVPQDEKCIVLNDITQFTFLYLIDKQGYVFQHNHLPTEWIHDMVVNHGVRYLYSDSRAVDERPDVQPYISNIILEKGNIRVFKLQTPATASDK